MVRGGLDLWLRESATENEHLRCTQHKNNQQIMKEMKQF